MSLNKLRIHIKDSKCIYISSCKTEMLNILWNGYIIASAIKIVSSTKEKLKFKQFVKSNL